MPKPVRVLFAGESWMTHSVHTKGFDSFDMSSYNEGGTEMIAALRAGDVDLSAESHCNGLVSILSERDRCL
jgi:uncharacterized membrane protein